MFCSIDWAERHHDVALIDEAGTLLAKARITDDAAGCPRTPLCALPSTEIRAPQSLPFGGLLQSRNVCSLKCWRAMEGDAWRRAKHGDSLKSSAGP